MSAVMASVQARVLTPGTIVHVPLGWQKSCYGALVTTVDLIDSKFDAAGCIWLFSEYRWHWPEDCPFIWPEFVAKGQS